MTLKHKIKLIPLKLKLFWLGIQLFFRHIVRLREYSEIKQKIEELKAKEDSASRKTIPEAKIAIYAMQKQREILYWILGEEYV